MTTKVGRLLLGSLAILAGISCADSTTPGDPNLIRESHWVLSLVQTPRGTFDASGLSQRPTISFGLAEESVTLPVSGFGGCNQFGGRAVVTANQIAFDELVATEIYCPGVRGDVEAEYFDVLGAATTFETGLSFLVIETDDGSRVRFETLSQ